MSSDPREAIALLRYRIVAAATDPRLTPAERGQLVRELAAQAYEHPDGSRYTYSRGTLDRWVRAYRDQGLDGLRPPPRADLGAVRRHPELLEEACQLRQELPGRSAAQIAAILTARHGIRIPERTIRAHFRRRGLHRAALAGQPRAFGRFEAERPNERWMTTPCRTALTDEAPSAGVQGAGENAHHWRKRRGRTPRTKRRGRTPRTRTPRTPRTPLEKTPRTNMTGLARLAVGAGSPLPALIEAYRTGGGVPYAAYGLDTREGIAEMNRPMFINLLGSEWLPAIPEVHARLQADPPARVADVGCGTGWSSIVIGRSYPTVRVDGLDLDEASIATAQANARQAGVADRVRFELRDAADPQLAGQYNLVTAFETLHDMARPVEALRAMRGLLAEDGSVLIADERVAETFAAPGGEIDRFNYGWSILHCLPASRAESPSAATGTVMRPPLLRRYAAEAGFRDVQVLPIQNDFWRFYRLVP